MPTKVLLVWTCAGLRGKDCTARGHLCWRKGKSIPTTIALLHITYTYCCVTVGYGYNVNIRSHIYGVTGKIPIDFNWAEFLSKPPVFLLCGLDMHSQESRGLAGKKLSFLNKSQLSN